LKKGLGASYSAGGHTCRKKLKKSRIKGPGIKKREGKYNGISHYCLVMFGVKREPRKGVGTWGAYIRPGINVGKGVGTGKN